MISVILQLEAQLSELLGWPSWALVTIQVLVVCVIAASLLETLLMRRASNHTSASTQATVATTEFRIFQLQYLGVYLTIMLADWLQGTNMYTLYSVRCCFCCIISLLTNSNGLHGIYLCSRTVLMWALCS